MQLVIYKFDVSIMDHNVCMHTTLVQVMTGSGFPSPTQESETSSPFSASTIPFSGNLTIVGGAATKDHNTVDYKNGPQRFTYYGAL